MTIFKEIMDTLKDVDGYVSAEDFLTQNRKTSVASKADEGILQFPVIISRKLDYSSASMITKSLERQFTSFVMIATSLEPIMATGGNARDNVGRYLRRFHQNTRNKYTSTDFITDMGRLSESAICEVEGENVSAMGFLCENSTATIINENKNMQYCMEDYLNPVVANNIFVPLREADTTTGPSDGESMRAAMDRMRRARNADNGTRNNNRNSNVGGGNNGNNGGNNGGNGNSRNNRDHRDAPINQNTFINNPGAGNNGGGNNRHIISDKILRDNDVKKANELVPTTLHLTVIMTNTEGTANEQVDFLVGVKALLHPVDSDEVVDNMVRACEGKGKLFKFIRWTTGELSFVKDLLLNITDIKHDAVSRSSGASHWWTALKRRKNMSKIKNRLHLPSALLPNSSIVITMDEAEFIKSEFGYDLLNPHFVDKIMEEYFLLSFVIVDNASEIAHFKFEGRRDYESQTFSSLERENANSKNMDAKEVVKLLNKM